MCNKMYICNKFHNMNAIATKSKLELYFQQFRKDIIGINQSFMSPFGE